MHQIGGCWLIAERSQPLQQLRGIRVVAELFESGDLRSDRNVFAEDLHFVGFALDGETAGARSLESDEQDEVSRVWEALRQMMKDATSGDHATGRNDDRRHSGVVDLLGFFGGRGEGESRPRQRRSILDRKSTRLNSSHRCISY